MPVDHDQRETLNTGFTANLPLHTWFSTNVYYGSGFSNGLAGLQLRALSRATTCPCIPPSTFRRTRAGRAVEVLCHVINVTNHRVLLDNSSPSAASTITIRGLSRRSCATGSTSEQRSTLGSQDSDSGPGKARTQIWRPKSLQIISTHPLYENPWRRFSKNSTQGPAGDPGAATRRRALSRSWRGCR